MENRLKYFLLIFSGCFCLILLLFLGGCIGYFSVLKGKRKPEKRISSRYYQLMEPALNHTSPQFGFVKLGRILSKEEYISYYDENRKSLMIISNFGDRRYECTGSCFCGGNNEEDVNKRRSITSLTNGIFVLLSAVSITMATKVAAETFLDSCQREFQDSCDDTEIKAEVDECKEEGTDELEKEIEREAKQAFAQKNPSFIREYVCLGFCLKNNKLRSKEAMDALGELGECTKFQTAGIIHVIGGTTRNGNYYAKNKFAKNYLKEFCKTVSSSQIQRATRVYQGTTYFTERTISVCVSTHSGDSYQNISCLLNY